MPRGYAKIASTMASGIFKLWLENQVSRQIASRLCHTKSVANQVENALRLIRANRGLGLGWFSFTKCNGVDFRADYLPTCQPVFEYLRCLKISVGCLFGTTKRLTDLPYAILGCGTMIRPRQNDYP
jgi:hypothetical protein